MKYWCATNSNLAYFIELTTALECQKQLLMSSISNLGGRESLEIAVNNWVIQEFLLVDFAKTQYTRDGIDEGPYSCINLHQHSIDRVILLYL